MLLIEFRDLFEPNSLPPEKPYDHTIILKPNTKPINVWSYRYPPRQKIEIEKLIKDMLQKSIIQPSHSLFASLVLLVTKKDGS